MGSDVVCLGARSGVETGKTLLPMLSAREALASMGSGEAVREILSGRRFCLVVVLESPLSRP
jgi:hypothetical protein